MSAFSAMKGCALTLAALIAAALAAPAIAAPVRDGHVVADLISRETAIVPGRPVTLAVQLKMDEHWHTYWRNSGDSGLPTTIKWTLPSGFSAADIQWPVPERLPLSTIMNYGYEHEVLLPVTVHTAQTEGGRATIRAKVDWLVCSAEECIPGTANLSLTLPVGSTMEADPLHRAAFQASDAAMPKTAANWQFSSVRNSDGSYVLSARSADGRPAPARAYFFAQDANTTEASAAQAPTLKDGVLSVTLKPSQYADGTAAALNGVWVSDAADGWGDGVKAVQVQSKPGAAGLSGGATGAAATQGAGSTASAGLVTILGMLFTAFLGGMILNLMPCVFPVLSIKIMGFVQSAGTDKRKIALHGWAYVAGVMASFWLLAGTLMAMRLAGAQLAWGFQLQSPIIVVTLCMLLIVLAFSLFGIFEIGAGLVGAAGRVRTGNGLGGSFLSGVLATVLATPCTAPFMGTALAFALTQSTLIGFFVFTALAAGLAAPYLLLSLRPDWLKFMPRPGAWMDAVKQAMAFPLLGTVIWLLWVFGLQTGMDGLLNALIALLLLGIGLWVWGRWGSFMHRSAVRFRALALLGITVIGALHFAYTGSLLVPPAQAAAGSADTGTWQAYSPERVAQLQAQGKAVFVDFNAAWCATCIVNKKMVLDTPEIQKAFLDRGVVLLEADWTRRDAVITRMLSSFGRSGVPLHVLYAPGQTQPLLVADLVSKQEIVDALAKLPSA